MTRRTILCLGAFLLAAGLAIVWASLRRDHPVRQAAVAAVQVVSTGAIGSSAGATTAVPEVNSELMPPPRATDLHEMAKLTINERADRLAQRSRDASWSAQAEIALGRQLRESGIVPGAIRCADTLCSVVGTIATRSPADRQRIVDQLVRGRLHAAYDRAGLAPMQAISIDADDAGTLSFTEYVTRK